MSAQVTREVVTHRVTIADHGRRVSTDKVGDSLVVRTLLLVAHRPFEISRWTCLD